MMSLKDEISRGETTTCEFKETFRYDVKTERVNKLLKFMVSKAICAMLNNQGGKVLIGVTDDKRIVGVERDMKTYGKGEPSNLLDKLLIDINKHITDTVGISYKRFLSIEPIEISGKIILKVEVTPTYEPVFHSDGVFYVRDGPRTIPLSGKLMGEYISNRKKGTNIKSLPRIPVDEISNLLSSIRSDIKYKVTVDRLGWVFISDKNSIQAKIDKLSREIIRLKLKGSDSQKLVKSINALDFEFNDEFIHKETLLDNLESVLYNFNIAVSNALNKEEDQNNTVPNNKKKVNRVKFLKRQAK